MDTVRDIHIIRGIATISFDTSESIRIRACDLKKQPLNLGDELEIEEYLDGLASIQFKDAMETALSILDISAKSEYEIRKKLVLRGFVPAVIEAVSEKLKELRFVDDASYAARIVHMNKSKPVGMYAVKQKLRAKGIQSEDIDDALSVLDDGQQIDAAKEAGQKLLRKYASLPYREKRAKLSQALARRGFSWDSIDSVLPDLVTEDDYD